MTITAEQESVHEDLYTKIAELQTLVAALTGQHNARITTNDQTSYTALGRADQALTDLSTIDSDLQTFQQTFGNQVQQLGLDINDLSTMLQGTVASEVASQLSAILSGITSDIDGAVTDVITERDLILAAKLDIQAISDSIYDDIMPNLLNAQGQLDIIVPGVVNDLSDLTLSYPHTSIQEGFDVVDVSLGTIDATVTQHTQTLTGVDSSITNLSATLITVEDDIVDVGNDVLGLQSTAASHNTKILAAEANLVTQQASILSIETDVVSVTGDLGTATANITTQSGLIADMQGNSAATLSILANSGSATAGFEFVATDGPDQAPISGVHFYGDQIIIPGSIYANHLVVDGYVDLISSSQSGFRYGKTSASSNVTGLFFGRTNSGFGFSAGVANGPHLSADSSGVSVRGAKFLIEGGNLTTGSTTTSKTVTLPSNTETVTLQIQGGGGGGKGGQSNGTSTTGNGGNGGTTSVAVKNGNSTQTTKSASGGAGGNSHGWTGQAGGTAALDPRGNGGRGGDRYYDPEWNNLPGEGGNAGQFKTYTINVASYGTPKLTINIGGGGNGPGNGQNGTGGKVIYSYSAAADVHASPLANEPSAAGTFSVSSGSSGNFPNLATKVGMWFLTNVPNGFNVNLGNGTRQVEDAKSMVLIASARPSWNTAHNESKTVTYRYFPMNKTNS